MNIQQQNAHLAKPFLRPRNPRVCVREAPYGYHMPPAAGEPHVGEAQKPEIPIGP